MRLKIKGIEKFQEKLPILKGKRIIIIPIYTITIVSLTTLFLIFFDSKPNRFSSDNIFPVAFYPFIGNMLGYLIGGLLVWQMWIWKKKLKAKYGQYSYQRVAFFGIAGVIIVINNTFHSYFPLKSLAPSY
ncbi:MAG: hypothetical protein ACTSRZ_10760 [Promethearchaeota archaeon]